MSTENPGQPHGKRITSAEAAAPMPGTCCLLLVGQAPQHSTPTTPVALATELVMPTMPHVMATMGSLSEKFWMPAKNFDPYNVSCVLCLVIG